MNSNRHFLLSFLSSIVLAIMGAGAVLLMRDWLGRHGLPYYIIALGVFVGVQLAVRWFFSNYVRVQCPFGCGAKALPLPGRPDRFRCEACGQTF